MNISALIENKKDEHVIVLSTNGREQSLTIQPKLDGFGSSANGGELLFLALATCYCNDLPHPMRALAPVLYLRQGTFVIVLLRQEKAVKIVGIIHRRKVRLATGKV